jgi:hypothetical protein
VRYLRGTLFVVSVLCGDQIDAVPVTQTGTISEWKFRHRLNKVKFMGRKSERHKVNYKVQITETLIDQTKQTPNSNHPAGFAAAAANILTY